MLKLHADLNKLNSDQKFSLTNKASNVGLREYYSIVMMFM